MPDLCGLGIFLAGCLLSVLFQASFVKASVGAVVPLDRPVLIPDQAVGQQLVESTTASLLMSLESIFSLIGGYLLLQQTMSKKELLGALLLFIAVILCQIPEGNRE